MRAGMWPREVSLLTESPINTAGTGDNILVAGVSVQTIRVHKIFFVCDTTTVISFKSGSTALTGPITLTPGGSVVLDFDSAPWFTTFSGDGFVINQTGTAQLSGRVYYQIS